MNRHPRSHDAAHAHRLPRWQRVVLDATGAALLASGIVWLAVHYSVGAGAGELPHPAESWSLRLHGLAAFGGVFMFGVLAAGHVPHGLRLARRRRWAGQRNTGLALCAATALLVLSGYLLFYFASEATRPALGWAHAGIGVVLAWLLAWHRRGARGGPAAP